MARNLNVYGIVIQFLHEANRILTSSRNLDEMPPHIDALLISAHGEVRLHCHPTSKLWGTFSILLKRRPVTEYARLAPTHMLTEHLLRAALGWFWSATRSRFGWGWMTVDDPEDSPHPQGFTVKLRTQSCPFACWKDSEMQTVHTVDAEKALKIQHSFLFSSNKTKPS